MGSDVQWRTRNVHHEARSRRPPLLNDDLVRKVNERVRDDRLFTISDLSLRFQGIYDIFSSHLGYRKVCAWLVPKMIKEDHKKQRAACALVFLNALTQGRRKHVEPYCDRRWDMGVPHHIWIKTAVIALEAYWLAEKKKFRRFQQDHVNSILVEFLPQGTTINSAVYCETLKKLRRAAQNKRRGMLSATILLLHDNARPHSAAQAQHLITSFRWEQMDHPRTGLIWAKWFSPHPTPKELPKRQGIWRRWSSERCSAEVANIAGCRILWGGYTKTCAPLR